jgi:hypothetical protein
MEDNPVTVSIDLTNLPPQQAFAIAQEAGLEYQEECSVGLFIQGDTHATENFYPAEFEIPLGPALTLLSDVGEIDLPENPNDVNAEEIVDE